jgi:hypothetical protein
MTKDIVHVGVKGMRWGVRKDQSSSVKSLSNQELKARIERMNLEKSYTRLTQEQSTVSKGISLVTSIVGNAAKQTLTNALSKQMGGVIDGVLSSGQSPIDLKDL